MKASYPRAVPLAVLCLLLPAGLAQSQEAAPSKVIPFDQLGAEAQKQYSGDGIGITPTNQGARLRAAMQDLEAEATAEGLWLTSTSDEDQGKPNRFRVRAVAVGRDRNSARVAEPAKGSDGHLKQSSERCARSATSANGTSARVAEAANASDGRVTSVRLPTFGSIQATKGAATWLRPGLIEEYSASMDGTRQDPWISNYLNRSC